MSQLERLRDQQLPLTLLQSSELRGRLLEYSLTGDEAKRISFDPIFGLENSFKAQYGQHQALLRPRLHRRPSATPRPSCAPASPPIRPWLQRIGDPWADLERVQATARDLYLPYPPAGDLGGRRLDPVRDGPRHRSGVEEHGDDRSAERRAGLVATRWAPRRRSRSDMEEIRLRYWLSKTREYLTVDNPEVKALLGRESPEALADRLITGTRMADAGFRAPGRRR